MRVSLSYTLEEKSFMLGDIASSFEEIRMSWDSLLAEIFLSRTVFSLMSLVGVTNVSSWKPTHSHEFLLHSKHKESKAEKIFVESKDEASLPVPYLLGHLDCL